MITSLTELKFIKSQTLTDNRHIQWQIVNVFVSNDSTNTPGNWSYGDDDAAATDYDDDNVIMILVSYLEDAYQNYPDFLTTQRTVVINYI